MGPVLLPQRRVSVCRANREARRSAFHPRGELGKNSAKPGYSLTAVGETLDSFGVAPGGDPQAEAEGGTFYPRGLAEN